eukprot:2218431-Pyramimonas_sp.AAC.1
MQSGRGAPAHAPDSEAKDSAPRLSLLPPPASLLRMPSACHHRPRHRITVIITITVNIMLVAVI